MNVLLTGGSGFLGRNLLLHAPSEWFVVATYRKSGDFAEFVRDRCEKDQVDCIQCDLEDPDAVEALVARAARRFDLCVFLAANTSVPLSVQEPAADLRANTLTVLNVLKFARIGRFVFLSSGAVYDGVIGPVGPETPVAPSLPYAISKLAAELYIRRAHVEGRVPTYSLVRFFGAYGPYEPPRKVYSRLVNDLGIKRQASFEIYGDGSNLIDAMYVDDAVAALLKVCADTRPALTVDLARGEPISVRELVSRAARHFLGREVPIGASGVAHEAINFRPESRVFEELYNFKCTVSLEDGLDRLLAHHLEAAHAP